MTEWQLWSQPIVNQVLEYTTAEVSVAEESVHNALEIW